MIDLRPTDTRGSVQRVRVSYDAGCDWLEVLPHGFALDGQGDDWFIPVDAHLRYVRAGPHGAIVGFCIRPLSRWHRAAAPHRDVDGPLFEALDLDLRRATATTIANVAAVRWTERSTPDRILFDAACAADREDDAVTLWLAVLALGDDRAYYGLGTTLCSLGRYPEAHDCLREYARMVPDNAWAWSWLGRACEGRDDEEGARQAYESAVRIERDGGFSTDAPRLLRGLDARAARRAGNLRRTP